MRGGSAQRPSLHKHRSGVVTEGTTRAPHCAFLRGTGYDEADFDRSLQFAGPARVFENQEACMPAVAARRLQPSDAQRAAAGQSLQANSAGRVAVRRGAWTSKARAAVGPRRRGKLAPGVEKIGAWRSPEALTAAIA
ncbi:hypothetical protein [Piscinibacter koreensis]|uniref:Uncharacterized protein n=1 Tax=Piscinibacter koreensis TaxID=2742824 RepID=A0A7Y6TYA4_9BURK|nr:hypothetical protein [Schlegelella koreensis]NUZ08014.1 hypothetical protein [Schlegelella koreensis]